SRYASGWYGGRFKLARCNLCTFDDLCRSVVKKSETELVRGFHAQPERVENRVREVSSIVGNDGCSATSDCSRNDMDITHIRQGNGAEDLRIGVEIRAWECFCHLRASVGQS